MSSQALPRLTAVGLAVLSRAHADETISFCACAAGEEEEAFLDRSSAATDREATMPMAGAPRT